VRWNALEQSWDCPAHGSRFDPCGHAINSPTAHDLRELDRDIEADVRSTEDAAPLTVRETSSRLAQSAGYLAVGLWPIVHFQSFAAVTGARRAWPARLFGAALAAVGASLLARGGTSPARGTRALSIGGALALAALAGYAATRRLTA
jgi:hypothetical protein